MRHSGSACPPKLSPPRSRFGEAGSAKAEPGMFQIKCRSGHFEEYSMSTPKSVRGKTTATTSKLAFLKELPGKLRLPKLTNIFFPADCYLGTVKGSAESKAVRFSPSADPFLTAMRFSQKMPHPGLVVSVLRDVDKKPSVTELESKIGLAIMDSYLFLEAGQYDHFERLILTCSETLTSREALIAGTSQPVEMEHFLTHLQRDIDLLTFSRPFIERLNNVREEAERTGVWRHDVVREVVLDIGRVIVQGGNNAQLVMDAPGYYARAIKDLGYKIVEFERNALQPYMVHPTPGMTSKGRKPLEAIVERCTAYEAVFTLIVKDHLVQEIRSVRERAVLILKLSR